MKACSEEEMITAVCSEEEMITAGFVNAEIKEKWVLVSIT